METRRETVLGNVKERVAGIAGDVVQPASLPLETDPEYDEIDVPSPLADKAAEGGEDTPVEITNKHTAQNDWSGVSFGGRGIAIAAVAFVALFLLIVFIPKFIGMFRGPETIDNPYGVLEKRVDDAFSSQ